MKETNFKSSWYQVLLRCDFNAERQLCGVLIAPTLILTENDADHTKGIKSFEMTALLTKAVQELQAEVVDLKTELAALKKHH